MMTCPNDEGREALLRYFVLGENEGFALKPICRVGRIIILYEKALNSPVEPIKRAYIDELRMTGTQKYRFRVVS